MANSAKAAKCGLPGLPEGLDLCLHELADAEHGARAPHAVGGSRLALAVVMYQLAAGDARARAYLWTAATSARAVAGACRDWRWQA